MQCSFEFVSCTTFQESAVKRMMKIRQLNSSNIIMIKMQKFSAIFTSSLKISLNNFAKTIADIIIQSSLHNSSSIRLMFESVEDVLISFLSLIKSNLKQVIKYFWSIKINQSMFTWWFDWNKVRHDESFDAIMKIYTFKFFKSLTVNFDWVKLSDARLSMSENMKLHLMSMLRLTTLSLLKVLQLNCKEKRLFACNDEESWVCFFYEHLHFSLFLHSFFFFISTLFNSFIFFT